MAYFYQVDVYVLLANASCSAASVLSLLFSMSSLLTQVLLYTSPLLVNGSLWLIGYVKRRTSHYTMDRARTRADRGLTASEYRLE